MKKFVVTDYAVHSFFYNLSNCITIHNNLTFDCLQVSRNFSILLV